MTLTDWKNLPITEEFLLELKRRVVELKDALAGSAGINPQADSFRSGAIAALEDVVNFHFDTEVDVD